MGIRMLLCLGWVLLTAAASATDTIPQTPVEPSPWWTIERFGQNLVTKTTIDRENKRLVLTIDGRVWANLDYLGRYSVVHHLGSTVTPYGYSLLLETQRQRVVAALNPVHQTWEISPPTLGALPLRANPSPLR
jgi:hypothetical protein